MSLLAYLIAGAALIGALGGLYWKVDSSGYARAEAELQPKIDACHAAVQKQNEAVAALKAEGDRRVGRATKGVAASAVVTRAAVDEARRLRILAEGALPAPTDCPAGVAVQQIRKGLK